jgi:hypothetical protein
MDAISFLCVSLGSSTVQLHDSVGSRRTCSCSEAGHNGDYVWVYYRRAPLWKGPTAKDIHDEMFPVYDGKCLSRTPVHNWVQKFSQGRSKVADDARPVWKDFCVYQGWLRIFREITVFSGSNIIFFTFYILLWPIYWLLRIFNIMVTLSVLSRTLSVPPVRGVNKNMTAQTRFYLSHATEMYVCPPGINSSTKNNYLSTAERCWHFQNFTFGGTVAYRINIVAYRPVSKQRPRNKQ